MSLLAIALVSLSAAMHAGWNLFTKSRQPTTAFFLIATIAGALLLSPAVVWNWQSVVHEFPARVWLLLTLSGLFLALYFSALAGAYRVGDLSVAYPLSRAIPVVIVTSVTWVLGLGTPLSAMALAGAVLIVVGCFLIPLRQFHDWRLRNYWNPRCGLALLAAIGTAGYSILDDQALELLREDPTVQLNDLQATLTYASLEGLAASVWLAILALHRRRMRETFVQTVQEKLRQAIFAGIAIYVTYTIVLVALAFVDNVSYVVAFRQLSIPLGTTLGILILNEAAHRPKVFGVAVMFVGLVLLALA